MRAEYPLPQSVEGEPRPYIARASVLVKLYAVDDDDAREQLQSTGNWEDWELGSVTYVGPEPERKA